jgi:hypothetical protein
MWATPAECEALLCAAHRTPDAHVLARIDALTSGRFDWDRCRALARHHGVMPLMTRALFESGTRACPPEIWNQLIGETRAIAIDNLSATAELFAIVEDLNEAGIAALAVKGPVAALSLYGDIALRPFLDLDLMVSPEDRDRAIECLAGRGYQRVCDLDAMGWRRYFRRYVEMCWIHPETGCAVDLHWALLNPRYRYSAVLTGCEERAVALLVGARRIRVLCPEDMLLHSLLHAAKHHWKLLRFLVDVALAIEVYDDLDWGTIARAVEKAPGSRRVVAVGLRLVKLLFGVPVNGLTARWIAGDASAEELAREAFCFLTRRDVPPQPGPPWPWRQLFYRSMCRLDRLRYTYDEMLAPTTLEWIVAPLPEWLGWAYPAIRIARLTEKHVWRSLSRPVKHAASTSTRQRPSRA